jgi:hypothetical protein
LTDGLAAALPDADCFVLAMNDAARWHAYPPRVRFEIAEGDGASYRRAADFLNVAGLDVVSVQHEYGIFGGKAGSHLLTLLRQLRMPIVTTLHTILAEPSVTQRAVLDEVSQLSQRLVVMSAQGAELLREVHPVATSKIDLIPHGIPAVPPIFGPEADYERHGDVGNLTFPCGYTLAPDGDTVNLYYGAADTSMALASGSIRQLLAWLDEHGSPERNESDPVAGGAPPDEPAVKGCS